MNLGDYENYENNFEFIGCDNFLFQIFTIKYNIYNIFIDTYILYWNFLTNMRDYFWLHFKCIFFVNILWLEIVELWRMKILCARRNKIFEIIKIFSDQRCLDPFCIECGYRVHCSIWVLLKNGKRSFKRLLKRLLGSLHCFTKIREKKTLHKELGSNWLGINLTFFIKSLNDVKSGTFLLVSGLFDESKLILNQLETAYRHR